MFHSAGHIDYQKVSSLVPVLKTPRDIEPSRRAALGRPPPAPVTSGAASCDSDALPPLPGSRRGEKAAEASARAMERAAAADATAAAAAVATAFTKAAADVAKAWPGHPLAAPASASRGARGGVKGGQKFRAGRFGQVSMCVAPSGRSGSGERDGSKPPAPILDTSLYGFLEERDRSGGQVIFRGGPEAAEPLANHRRQCAQHRREALLAAAEQHRRQARDYQSHADLERISWREERRQRQAAERERATADSTDSDVARPVDGETMKPEASSASQRIPTSFNAFLHDLLSGETLTPISPEPESIVDTCTEVDVTSPVGSPKSMERMWRRAAVAMSMLHGRFSRGPTPHAGKVTPQFPEANGDAEAANGAPMHHEDSKKSERSEAAAVLHSSRRGAVAIGGSQANSASIALAGNIPTVLPVSLKAQQKAATSPRSPTSSRTPRTMYPSAQPSTPRCAGGIGVDPDVETSAASPSSGSTKRTANARIQMINALHKIRKRQGRMERLLRVRRSEFEAKPEDEKEALRHAFLKADPLGTGALHSRALRGALEMCGIDARTDIEKRELKILCDEITVIDTDFFLFVFDAVPRARQLLKELRRYPLQQDFVFYDKDKSGMLDREECLCVLHKMYTWNLDGVGLDRMATEFSKLVEKCAVAGQGFIDFAGFESLVDSAQEKYNIIVQAREQAICTQHGLTDEVAEQHWDEICFLWETFKREARFCRLHGELRADPETVRRMLVDFMFMRPEFGGPRFLQLFLDTDEQHTGTVSFTGFLALVRKLRAWVRFLCREELKVLFNKFDRDRSGCLDVNEVTALVSEMGLMPQCREDQVILRKLFSQVDKDNTGDVNFEEFQMFVERIAERIRAVRTIRERRCAAAAGFDAGEVAQLREAFYLLCQDADPILGLEALRQVADASRCTVSSDRLRQLLAKYDRDGKNGLNFEQFALFIREVLDDKKSGGRRLE